MAIPIPTQNVRFPYQKLNPSIQWQNSILHDLAKLYENSIAQIKPFLILENTTHIFRLLSENMNFLPNYDKNTAMSVTEIAYTCGFSNTSYFCELFHKFYDTTPGKFRGRNG